MVSRVRFSPAALSPDTIMNANFLNQINLSKLFQTDYLFEIAPQPIGLYLYLAIIFGVLVAVAIVLIFLTKSQEKLQKIFWQKVINWLLVTGLLGLALLFFRYEAMAYLGSRIVFLMFVLVAIIWAITIIWYKAIVLPKKLAIIQKKKNFEKYLP